MRKLYNVIQEDLYPSPEERQYIEFTIGPEPSESSSCEMKRTIACAKQPLKSYGSNKDIKIQGLVGMNLGKVWDFSL